MSVLPNSLHVDAVVLPPYDEYEREVTDGGARMSGIPTMVYLPDALWLDYYQLEQQAQSLGWTLGKLLGYLAIHGAAALTATEKAQ